MIRSTNAILLGAALASSCAMPGSYVLQRVAERPEAFVGQTLRICGYVTNGHEDHGIWRSARAHARQDRAILGLIPSSPRGPYAERACISGRIVRTGCGAEIQCIDRAGDVPFALREEPAG